MKHNYYESIAMIESVYRLFLDALRFEINKLSIKDITNVSAVLLYNIGDKTLCVGDLKGKNLYLGSNVSYNLRHLVENGYVIQQPNKHDRRSSELSRTKKGRELCEKLDHVFEEQAKFLQEKGLSKNKLEELMETLSLFDKNLRNKR